MKCLLHIGTEKTATTTLQRFFDRSREALATRGIAYTRSAGVGNNWRLAVAAYDDCRQDDRSLDAGVDGPESRRRFRTALVAELTEELAAIEAHHAVDSLLISSEHLHSRLTTPAEIERLRLLLGELGVTGTQVLVYLRDPLSLAASLHSTVVKHGSTRRVPPPPDAATYYRHLCDHQASIKRWEAVFDDVTPRLFEPDAMVGGSVVADMVDALGLDGLATELEPEHTHLNRSLSTAEVEVLARINEREAAVVDGRPNPTQAELVAALERHSTGPGYRLPPRMAKLYREEFADSNEWVRDRFFPERPHLFAAEHPDHDPGPSPPGYDGLASLIAELWTQLER